MGSVGFLVIFAAVNVAQYRLRSHGDPRLLPLIGAAACVLATAALAIEAGPNDPLAAAIAGGLVGGSFVIEVLYRSATGRSITHRFAAGGRRRVRTTPSAALRKRS